MNNGIRTVRCRIRTADGRYFLLSNIPPGTTRSRLEQQCRRLAKFLRQNPALVEVAIAEGTLIPTRAPIGKEAS